MNEIRESQTRKKCIKIDKVLNPEQPYIELDQLRNVTWNGVPQTIPSHRCDVWRLLHDYMPIDKEFWDEMLKRKREEYAEIVKNYFGENPDEAVVEMGNSDF